MGAVGQLRTGTREIDNDGHECPLQTHDRSRKIIVTLT